MPRPGPEEAYRVNAPHFRYQNRMLLSQRGRGKAEACAGMDVRVRADAVYIVWLRGRMLFPSRQTQARRADFA